MLVVNVVSVVVIVIVGTVIVTMLVVVVNLFFVNNSIATTAATIPTSKIPNVDKKQQQGEHIRQKSPKSLQTISNAEKQ